MTTTNKAGSNKLTKLIPIRDRAKLGYGTLTVTRPARDAAKK